MRSRKIKNFCSSSLWTCLHHMVILRCQNTITDFLMILAWASPFKVTPTLSNIHLNIPVCDTEVSIVGSLRDREVACSASDRQGSNFESCVGRTVSSQSSHHLQEVLLAQLSLYVHKSGLKPDSFHFFCDTETKLKHYLILKTARGSEETRNNLVNCRKTKIHWK